MSKEKLSERKQVILQALVDSYITTAEPISSAAIREKYLQDVSSATIRNELATLEDMGYLVQPHISAGRIPSSKAYRFYVDNLLIDGNKSTVLDTLRSHYEGKLSEVEEVVRNTAKIISDQTNYTSIIVLNGASDITIKEIKLVDLADGTALVVIITDSGVIKDKVISVGNGLESGFMRTATKMLMDIFAGKKVSEARDYEGILKEELQGYRGILDEVFEMVDSFSNKKSEKVFFEGTNKIFDYPEYDDIGNVKRFLSVLGEKEKLQKLVGMDEDIEFSIKIGKDDSDDLQNMAMVTARYSINGRDIGHAGVIGPERMDYKKVLSVLGEICKTIEILGGNKKLDGGNNGEGD